MGFFYAESKKSKEEIKATRSALQDAALLRLGCQACPLDKLAPSLKHPRMLPTGSKEPIVLIVGEAPGASEDAQGEQFIGKSGEIIRNLIPPAWRNLVMWDNTIRCRPPGNRNPTEVEMNCCRKYTGENVSTAKPFAILGLGGTPLRWATGESGQENWRGRFTPVKINDHTSWYFAAYHPAYLLYQRRTERPDRKTPYDITFENDIKNFFSALEDGLDDPIVYEPPYDKGIKVITGHKGWDDLGTIATILDQLMHEPEVAIDLETTGLRPYASDTVILSVAIGTFDRTVSFSLEHPAGWRDPECKMIAWRLFYRFIMTYKGKLIAQHTGFELEHIGFNFGKQAAREPEWHDTMLQGKALDERNRMHSLGVLTTIHFGFNIKEVFGVKATNWREYPIDQYLLYNAGDTKWTHLLFKYQERLLLKTPSLMKEYERTRRTSPTLVLTQLEGLVPDMTVATELEVTFERKRSTLIAEIQDTPEVKKYSATYGPFNYDSPAEVTKLLNDVLGLGVDGSDESILDSIEGFKSPKMIKELREVSKLLSTYIIPITSGKLIFDDGLIHPIFNQIFTRTGRLSADSPNIQNWPKRVYSMIRKILVAPDGHYLVSCDYGQIEARVMACASEDENFCEALWRNEDLHAKWARRIMELHPAVVDRMIIDYKLEPNDDSFEATMFSKLRDEVKNKVVFALFYGSVARSVSASMQVPEHMMERLVAEFWDTYSGIKKWHKTVFDKYQKLGYVETLTGSRRGGPLNTNALINTCAQGTAAHIVINGMNAISEYSYNERLPIFQPRINIHDDLSFYFPEELMEECIVKMAEILCCSDLPYIIVPLEVEVAAGKAWYGQEKIGKFSTLDFRSRDELRH